MATKPEDEDMSVAPKIAAGTPPAIIDWADLEAADFKVVCPEAYAVARRLLSDDRMPAAWSAFSRAKWRRPVLPLRGAPPQAERIDGFLQFIARTAMHSALYSSSLYPDLRESEIRETWQSISAQSRDLARKLVSLRGEARDESRINFLVKGALQHARIELDQDARHVIGGINALSEQREWTIDANSVVELLLHLGRLAGDRSEGPFKIQGPRKRKPATLARTLMLDDLVSAVDRYLAEPVTAAICTTASVALGLQSGEEIATAQVNQTRARLKKGAK